MNDDQLKMELVKVDIELKRKQAFWETPRNLVILCGTVAAIAGYLGYTAKSSTTTIVFPPSLHVTLDR